MIKKTQIIPRDSISDNELIITTLQLEKPHPKPVYITTGSFKIENYIKDAFLKDISNAPWFIVDTFDNVENFRSTCTSENC